MKRKIKQRNPIVMASIMKKGGVHQKTKKALRRQEKVSLMKEVA